jgi:hypothetical protein
MQRDSSTYCDEPSDIEDFNKWTATFSLSAQQPAIEALLADNAFMAELHARLVPVIVENEDFWTRYFYRSAGMLRMSKQEVVSCPVSQGTDQYLMWVLL